MALNLQFKNNRKLLVVLPQSFSGLYSLTSVELNNGICLFDYTKSEEENSEEEKRAIVNYIHGK